MADLRHTRPAKPVEQLRDEVIRLGPWHHKVAITPEIDTSVYLEAPSGTYPSSGSKNPDHVSLIDSHAPWLRQMKLLYPDGFQGRSFLECACNCGAYAFFSKEIGAGRTFGFDVRDHWIDQARFLVENRTVAPTDQMDFRRVDLYDLPALGLDKFDVTLFKGIFYHLPDPITGLRIAADLTREVLILDTAIRTDLPDGLLALGHERTESVMTGVYGLNWLPTGTDVLEQILRWLGFAEVKAVSRRSNPFIPNKGRVRVIGSRKAGMLSNLPEAEAALTASPPRMLRASAAQQRRGRFLAQRSGRIKENHQE